MNKRKKHKRTQAIHLTKWEKANVWTIKILSYTLGIIGLFSCFELDNIDNNLREHELVIPFGLLGFLITAVTWLTLSTKFNYVFMSKDSYFISGCLFVGFTFGTPAVANYYNRTTPKDISCKEYQIKKMNYKHGKRGFHHIYVDIGQSEERLTVTHETWHKLDGQNKVELCLANGGLSFEYVERIDIPN